MKTTAYLKSCLLAAALLCCAHHAAAQQDPVVTAEYAQQYNKLYKEYTKNPDNVVNLLALAEFYYDSLNPMQDYATAMSHISAAEQQFVAIFEDRDRYREQSRLIKKHVTYQLIRQRKHEIVSHARELLRREEPLTDAVLDRYGEAFAKDAITMRLVESKRLQNRYEQAREQHTLAAFRAFIDTYPSTSESEDAGREMGGIAAEMVADARSEAEVDARLEGYLDIDPVRLAAQNKKSSLAYARLEANPTPEAYRSFLAQYPGSNEYSLVLSRMDDLLKHDFSSLQTPREYADFALENPDNPLAEKAMERLKALIVEERDMEALQIYMEEFPLDVNYNDIYLQYYQWHTEEGNRAPIARFAAEHPDFPYKMAVSDALKEAARFDSIDINTPYQEKDFSKWASKIYHLTGKGESFVALQRMLQPLIARKDWKKAAARIDHFALSFEDYCVAEVTELKALLAAPADKRLVLSTVVRPAYDMMHPVMHPDGKHLYYCREVDGAMAMQMAERSAGKKGALWRSMGNAVFTNADAHGLTPYSFYDGGNKMLLGAAGDILVAEWGADGWTVTDTLPAPINSPYRDFDAYMLPDGSGLLLASDRPGGQNLQPSGSFFHGDTAVASDLYYVPMTLNGWGKVINLGRNVNSAFMECSPLISDDLKTLYFITDGRGGLGYGDLYYTTRDNVDDWKHWATPTNYGKEANSCMREACVTYGADRRTLVLNSNNGGRYGCYGIVAIHTANSELQGVTIASPERDLFVDIVDAGSQQRINTHQFVDMNEPWQSSFYSDKQYCLYAQSDDVFVPSLLFGTADGTVTPRAYGAVELAAMGAIGQTLPLPGIFFVKDGAELAACSDIELEHLATFLKAQPDMALELLMHVDGEDDEDCYELSEQRAQAIETALTAKGIDGDRILMSPYGNSETKHQRASDGLSVRFMRQ
ncbi:MAG: hypothetical protein IJM88_04435 [Bacteroidales bacterium]|nr:hypothetical protein [Bacteroidales bacterium]